MLNNCLLSCAGILLCSSLVGQPAGLTLISGEAIISSTDHNMLIQSGEKTILDWTRFSIAENERLHFQQTHAKSAVLNRVSGLEASHILGALSSNGKVFLINPAGIVVGANARIETSGFLASTFDVLNEDFLQERSLSFQGDSESSIVNQGEIQAVGGDIFLVARRVVNEGSLEALEGHVVLEAGCDILLRPKGSEHCFIRTHTLEEEEATLENSGTIAAAVAELRATANPYTKAIRQSGKILSIEKSGGKILLVAEEGVCEVSGSMIAQNAGTVHVLGDDVRLLDGALIDASGEFGGGTVLIGGDYQGKNEVIKNAKHTWAGQETLVRADALRKGNGGKIIFWSDEATVHYGQISARGGEEGGDGGLIEVSGKTLDFQGVADRRAPHGQMGLLLLDPINITISGADSGNVINPGGGGTYTFSGCASPATINAQTLVANLNLGSVTISTSATGGAGCPDAGSITVSSPITVDASANPWSAATTLTLSANAFISISAAITNTSASTGFTAMNFTAGGVGATTNPGISLNAGGVLTTTGGNISMTGTATGTTGACHGISLPNGSISTTGGGSITLNGTGGASSTASHGINIAAGADAISTLTGNGNISLTGVSSGGAAASVGVRIAGSNAAVVRSTSGAITISGTSAATLAGSHGVSVVNAWTPATTGLITFSNCTGGNTGASHGVNLGAAFTGSGDVTFSTCQGGTGGGHGINVAAAFTTAGTVTATTSITGRGTGGVGFASSANFSTTGASHPIAITASVTGTTGACHGISLTGGSMSTNAASSSITLNGTAGASSTAGHGINISGGSITTTSSDISLAGVVPVGATAMSAWGIYMHTVNGITSSSGNITLSGITNTSGLAGYGFLSDINWAAGTTGTITFQNCVGGIGDSTYGLIFFSGGSFSTSGDIIAINNISSGLGSGTNSSGGFYTNRPISSSGGNIQITASCTLATAGNSRGTGIVVQSGSSISTIGNGNITLIGTGSAIAGAASSGVHILSGSSGITTVNGTINVAGNMPGGTQQGIGVLLEVTNPLKSTSGAINVSGTSSATSAGSHGVLVTGSWTTGTSGAVTFGSSISDGTVTISGCQGGTGSGSHGVNLGAAFTNSGNAIFTNCVGGNNGTTGGNGINVSAAFTTAGTVTATTSIIGRGAGGIGFASSANFSTTGASHPIAITSSATGTTGACHGISLTGGIMSTNAGGSITLNGTGGASSTASHGINIAAGADAISTLTGNGNISLTGVSSGGAAASVGVRIAGSNAAVVRSTSGAITISGTSSATLADSHGVSVVNAWTPATTGLITFSNCTGGNTGASHGVNLGAAFTGSGDVTFSTCQGGTGGGHGINVAAAFTTAGTVTATSSITGRGNGGIGFASNANFSTTGSNTIAITANATGTSGACHGISLTGGSLSTASGSITLNGTSGASNTASFGVNLSSAANSITSTSGPISVTGTSQSTVAGSNGISINTNPWSTGTSAILTLTGTAGSTGASFGIDKGQALTSGGPIVFNGTSSGGAGSYGNRWDGNITTTGDALTVLGSTFLNSAVIVDTTNSVPAGADILFSGSGTTIDGTQNLTLLAGTGGAVTFGGAIGQTATLGNLAITSAKTTANAVNIGSNITAGSFTISTVSPVTILGNSIIDVSSTPGGSISFNSTINGTSAGAQALTLTVNATGTVTLLDNVGTTTRLGTMTVTGGVSGLELGSDVTNIEANSFIVGALTPTTFHNAALTIDTSANTGGSIAFGGSITGVNASLQSLTLTANATGSVTLSGDVGATRLGALTIGSGTGSFVLGSGITSIQATSLIIQAPATTTLQNTGLLTIDATNAIAFSGTIDGATNYAQDLTLTSSDIVFSGVIGSLVPLGAITIGNATDVSASSSIAAASFTQNAGTETTLFNGAIDLTGDLTLTGDNFTFNAPVNSANDVMITNDGLISIAAAADMTLTGSFQQLGGAGNVHIAGDIATTDHPISFTSPITLTGDVDLTIGGASGDIVFNGTGATVNGGYHLLLSSNSGGVEFDAAVGTVIPLTSLQVTGPGGILVGANQTVSTGPMSYTGPVTLTANTIFTHSGATGVTFSEPGGTAISGNRNLQIWATNSSINITGDVDLSGGPGNNGGNAIFTAQTGISVTGDIDLSGGDGGGDGGSMMFTGAAVLITGDIDLSGGSEGGDGGDANINGQTAITLDGRLITRGGDTAAGTAGAGGMAILIANAGSIFIHNIDTSGGSGTAPGASGGAAGIIGLMPSSATGFDNTPAATVIINADLGSSGNLVARGGTGLSPGSNGAGALINISANRPAPVSAATITSSLGGNDITIIGRTFTMGMNEVLTVLGNLSITGNNQINMGDTVALLNLTLSSPMINLAIHGTYNILSSLGTLYSNPILHFYAGQALSVTGTLSPTGPIAQTSFASTYTTPEFNDLLIYNSANILNFSTETPPPPPPPTPPPSPRIPTKAEKILTIYDLNIADIELFYQLPILNVDNYYRGSICNDQCCKKYFTSFIFENFVKEFEERTGACSE